MRHLFFARLTGPLTPKCTLTFAHSFAKLSRKYPYPQGAHQRKRKHQGPWRLALERPHFWKLGCCIWSLFLELQKATLGSNSGRCKSVLQDHAIWLWRSLTFGSLASTYEGKGKCAVPFSCRTPRRQEVVALTSCNVYNYTMIIIRSTQLSRNSCEKIFRELGKKAFARVPT